VAGSTFLFLEAEPVSVRFRAAEVESGWVAALACSAEVHLLAPEADFRELGDDYFLALVVDSPVRVADSLARAAGSPERADELVADSHEPEVDSLARVDVPAAGSHEPEVDSLARVDVPEVELLVPTADFREWVAALADSAEAHWHAPEADSRGWAGELVVDFPAPVAGSLVRVGEPGVELLVPAVDFRVRVAALADSAVVHSHAPEADFRELAAPSGSPELARSRALAVDCRVPLVSQVVLRSAYSAALPAAFLLRVAVADWLAVLQLCLPAALEQASHSTQCETRSVWVSSGQRE
jgi:hypothetical protein